MAALKVNEEAILEKVGAVPEVTYTKDMRVSCSGGDGALGHPKVFFNINDEGYAECDYCDRLFIYAPDKA